MAAVVDAVVAVVAAAPAAGAVTVAASAVPVAMTRPNARGATASDESCLKGKVLMVRQRLVQLCTKHAETPR
ncbi:hypothetical protein GCM10010140_10860 [Streptosporangium pseudovulgare]|uniref:Secreted protein n=1 Tax=Streptosporangium pseudovulgare TaxID=35765 RepID=A0ABQ2QKR1_9ACTN|nr:hypothetical protein GCM10010140_10860 [Streptosporangium pseudovulgare]